MRLWTRATVATLRLCSPVSARFTRARVRTLKLIRMVNQGWRETGSVRYEEVC